MTDRITEHYQENPEGARLVSDEDIPAQGRSASGKNKSTKAAGASEKQERSGRPAKSAKPTKTAKTAKSAKKSEPGKSDGASDVKKAAEEKSRRGKAPAESKAAKLAKKAAEGKPDLDESGEQSQSVKTPSVMRLVEERAFSENQVIAAGKSLIPRQLRGIEPLSKVMRREAEVQRSAQPDDEVSRSPMVMRELTEMVIKENVPGILRRFNACDCEKCMSELARLTAEEIPARYMKMPELADLSWSGFSSDERMLIDSLKKNAVTVMIRLMIANKKRNFH